MVDWDMVGSLTAVTMTIGGLISMWRKVTNDNARITKEVADHAEKIMLLVTSKANCSDLVKLGELVDKIERRVDNHHEDTVRHRTPDFEKRIEQLIATVELSAKENREAHEKIIAMMQRVEK